MALLEIDQVKKNYPVRKFGKKYGLMAVNGVSFDIEKGKCVGLVGESGCGKSTLGRLITGLENPTEGEIRFEGEKIHREHKKEGAGKLKFSGKIQLVFQDSFDAVNPRFTAKKIIEEPLKNFTSLKKEEREARVKELLGYVGIPLTEKDKYALEFSGGQLQRVCIARALASNPELLILDEPLSSLDVSVQAQILNLLGDLKEKLGLSYLLISHDLEAVYYLADVFVVMYGGQIMEKIDNIDYFNEMVHPYTRKLLSAVPSFQKNTQEQEKAETIWMDLGVQKEGYQGCPYSDRCAYSTEKCQQCRPDMQEIRKGHFVACHETDRFLKETNRNGYE